MQMKSKGNQRREAYWHPHLVPYKEGHRHCEQSNDLSDSQKEPNLSLRVFSHKIEAELWTPDLDNIFSFLLFEFINCTHESVNPKFDFLQSRW